MQTRNVNRGAWPLVVATVAFLVFAATKLSAQTNADEVPTAVLKKTSLEDLMKMDVTSVSKRPEPYAQAAAAIQVITQDDIRSSGASSIPEALRLADNLQVAQIDSRQWAISARGFNGSAANKLLVLIDGRSIYTPLFSGVFWDVQDYLLADIDRIEVISGPGGTLWGANAVNGVINIITRNAKDSQGLLVEAGGGTELRGFEGVRYGGKLATNVSYRVYEKYFNRDSTVRANGRSAQDEWQMGQTGFRVDWDANPKNLLTFQGDFYEGAISQTNPAPDVRVAGGNFLSRWSHEISADADLKLQLYYDRTHRVLPNLFGEDLDTYDLDFQHHFRLGDRHNFIWGAGYRFTHDDVKNAPPGPLTPIALSFLPAKVDHDVVSGFVQDEITLRENLLFTLGTKIEHNDYSGIEVQPSGRLSWNVTSNQTVWTAISRAVRAPSRIDRDFFAYVFVPGIPPPTLLAGGPNFKSETVIAYELGYRIQPHAKISASISGFYNDYDNLRGLNTNAVPPTIDNSVKAETYGAEVEATYQMLDWWRWRAGYTFIEEHFRIKPGKFDSSRGLGEASDPEQQFSLRSSMDLPGNTELDARLRWVDTLHNISNGKLGTVPSYLELDVRFSWHPTDRLELSIAGQNLLHDHHPEFGFPDPNRRSEIERGVYGKVSWKF